MSTLREALEAALVENPDDIAAHMAYADHLHDQGDPRGEFIQVQLALENKSLAQDERGRLAAREQTLLKQTREACLGNQLAALLAHRGGHELRHKIQRGWLVEVKKWSMPERELTIALATAPEARLLRCLAFGQLPGRYHASLGDRETPHVLEILGRSSNFRNLRALYLGTLDGFASEQPEGIEYHSRDELFVAGDRVWDWIANLPRLEELYLKCRTQNTTRLFGLPSLGNLRILQLNLAEDYPLDVLASNPVLTKLSHLSLHPLALDADRNGMAYLGREHLNALAYSPNLPSLTHLRFQKSDAGDEGINDLIASGLLPRLEFLDLAMGTITDEGARQLAEADLGDLEVLDLSGNAISLAGERLLSRALRRLLTLRKSGQHAPDDDEWLYQGEEVHDD
jgi:uncharacterized protein (TIGR02996 family)